MNSTARTVKKENVYKQIVKVIRESATEMDKSGNVDNILREKYSNLIKEREKKQEKDDEKKNKKNY